jgi:hypothetical protein
MQIYEAIRKKEHGIMLGAHVSLKPVLISEYSDNFEMLVVEIKASNKSIRVITGYGPQENVSTEERMPFFATLEQEIVSAKLSNRSIVIQMDANSKMGTEMVPKDTHEQTPNGAALAGVINRNDLIVVNSLNTKVNGSTTRKRITVDGIEESIIDFVIVSLDLVKDVENLLIDEQKEYALSKIVKRKNSVQVLHSDHHVMIASFGLSWNNEVPQKEDLFNFKDKDSLKKFKYETTNTSKLSEVFDSDSDLEVQTKKFLKLLKRSIHKCFKKVKIVKTRESEYDKLYKKWKTVRAKEDLKSKEEAEELETELANKHAEGILEKVRSEIDNIQYEEGGLNSGNLWRLKNKLYNKYPEPPTAMKDEHGNLLTGKEEILESTMNYYKKVLENRTIAEGLKEHQEAREDLAKVRMKTASETKPKIGPWMI